MQDLGPPTGLPNGFETDLWSLPVSRPYNPNGRRTAELMQADLEKVMATLGVEFEQALKNYRELDQVVPDK